MRRIRVLVLGVLVMLVPVASRGEADVAITPDVVYGHKHGLAMTFDVFRPKENPNGAALLFMVSGGWYSVWAPPEKTRPFFQPLLDKGFTVFAIRHGSSPKFSIPEAVDDVRLSVRYIRHHADRFQIDAERLGVFGMSAGGHLSLMLGTTSDPGDTSGADPVLKTSDRVKAVCAWVAPTDLRGMVREVKDRSPMYDRFPALDLPVAEAAKVSPLLHVTPDDAPTLLIAGDKDELVPIKHSQEIQVALEENKVRHKLVVIEGAGHGFGGKDLERAVAEMVDWFEQQLGK